MADNITIVTAFFKINKNKYNHTYDEWINNLLLNLNKNLIIFTCKEYYEIVKNARSKYEDKTLIIVTNIENFYMYKYLDYLKENLNNDHEKNYHNTDLYMIWNEKFKFVEKGILLNPFNTKYFAWCDIGYVRNPIYINMYMKNFPNVEKITEDKIYMLNIDYNFTEDDFKNPYNQIYRYISNTIGAGFIIGSADKFKEIIDIYYNKIIPTYIENDYFIGKEQNLYVSLYLNNPSLIKLIKGTNDNYTIPYSEFKWFYFLKYLS
jgi:hypothetical protein